MVKTFEAPAKINLCLHVLGRRPDGYHDLAMLMQRVSLADRVTIRIGGAPGVRVGCAGLELQPDEENIAARAARALLEKVGREVGVEIEIDKRIPVAAGLGGGSSDAATVLLGLNEMLALGQERAELMAIGGRLGADVPFFIFGAAAWATGIGDQLQEVPGIPPYWCLLVHPGVAVSTGWVYQNLGLTSHGEEARLPRFSGEPEELVRLLHNDLEQVTLARFPEVARAKQRLLEIGARGALMSGSGATVFGLFDSEVQARQAAERIETESGWRCFVVRPL